MTMRHSFPSGVETDGRLLVLSPDDNVAVALQVLPPGERIGIGGEKVDIPDRVAQGHKIATAPIRRGEAVIKYGVQIGSATADINIGDHVHLHNIRSNYTPTHALDMPPGGQRADDA